MRVFVSSTIFDLIDIRAELEALLRTLGATPVMSDDKLSDFHLAFDSNSIETCLLNVDSSDAVIVILDQRYGPRLGKHGFEDVSATHLEYRRARQCSKPIYFYVRDRLEADYNVQHRNGGAKDIALSWIDQKNIGLFELLREHRELRAESSQHNWFSLFTNSRDLKAAVQRHFEPVVKPHVLLEAIQHNRFPLFTLAIDAAPVRIGESSSIRCQATLKNIGLAPAFDFSTHWQLDCHSPETPELVGPGQEVISTLLSEMSYRTEIEVTLEVKYRAAIGIEVRERYSVGCILQGGIAPSMISGGYLVDRTYHSCPQPAILIQDA